METLSETLNRIAGLAERYLGKGLTEQDTKNALIEPVLGGLGWLKHDLDLVRAEYRHTSKDNPVDYALFSKGHPVLFVEAKALDVSIDDYRFITQVLNYANVSGVHWALLTNGRHWHLYSVFATVPADQKRFFNIAIGDKRAIEWLKWIAPDRLAGNDLERMWRHCFAERKLRNLLHSMIVNRDSDFIDLLVRSSGLPSPDVAAGLQHLKVTFSEPEPFPAFIDLPPETLTVDEPVKPQPPANDIPQQQVLPPEIKQPDLITDKITSPPIGARPAAWRIENQRWPLRYWRDAIVCSCDYLNQTRKEQFHQAFESDVFKVRKGRLIGRKNDAMRVPIEVPGGFAESHFSADSIMRFLTKLFIFCGVDLAVVGYEVDPNFSSNNADAQLLDPRLQEASER